VPGTGNDLGSQQEARELQESAMSKGVSRCPRGSNESVRHKAPHESAMSLGASKEQRSQQGAREPARSPESQQ